jgi:hypothetical protein
MAGKPPGTWPSAARCAVAITGVCRAGQASFQRPAPYSPSARPGHELVTCPVSLATAPRAASDQSARLALRPSYDWLASGSGVPLFRTLNSISHTFRSRIGCSSLAPIESIRSLRSLPFGPRGILAGAVRELGGMPTSAQPETNHHVSCKSARHSTTEESAPASTTALRQELPLRRAKAGDRLGPYNPMYGLYIRAFVVACWAARLHFDMKGTDL